MELGGAGAVDPSMKVPPKRKGNVHPNVFRTLAPGEPSMKVPPKRKGNHAAEPCHVEAGSLNESPSEKEGKLPAEEE